MSSDATASPTLLTYAVGTQPLPLQASPATGTPPQSTLTLLATNGTGAAVSLEGLQVTIPIGGDADDLTASTPLSWVTPAGWAQKAINYGAGDATYTFEPTAGSASVAAGQALTFVLNGVQVNSQAGTVALQVTEGSGGCTPPDCPVATILVTKVPAGGSVVSFWANPMEVSYGGSTVLGWTGPAGATYTLSYFDPELGQVTIPTAGQQPLAYSGEYPGAGEPALVMRETTVFTLNVSMAEEGESWSGQQQVTVVVGTLAPAILTFTGTLGGSADAPSLTLSWTTQNAQSCELDALDDLLKASGSHTLQWPLQTTYTLTANGTAGLTAQQTFTVPPSITLKGTCALGASGVEVTLTWNALLADDCTLSPGNAAVPTSGSMTVTPTATDPLPQAYTLTASNGSVVSTATAQLRWGPTAAGKAAWPFVLVFPPSATALSPDGTQVGVCQLDFYGDTPTMLPLLSAWSFPGFQQAGAPAIAMDGVGGAQPNGMAITPDGETLLTINAAMNTLGAYRIPSMGPSSPLLGVGQAPAALCVAPDGAYAFVACPGDDAVRIVGLVPVPQLGSSLSTTFAPMVVAVSPDGSTLYAAGDMVQGWTHSEGGWTPFASRTGLTATARALAPGPDGTRLYAACADETLWALDAQTLDVVLGPVALRVGPASLAVSPDGARLFVGSTTTPEVTVVDTGTLQAVETITYTTAFPSVVGLTPGGACLFVVSSPTPRLYATIPAGYFT